MIRLCLLAFAAAALLAGCGVKGDPQPPAGTADGFPRAYPPGAPGAAGGNIFVDRRR